MENNSLTETEHHDSNIFYGVSLILTIIILYNSSLKRKRWRINVCHVVKCLTLIHEEMKNVWTS